MILGSGLGGFADNIKEPAVIKYHDIPNWNTGCVMGHKSQLVIGALKSDPGCIIVAM
jgi:purine-nucleoside phosphorylase